MRHSWKQEKANQGKHRHMNKQHKHIQHKQQQTTANAYMFLLFRVVLCLLCPLLTYTGTCGIVGNKKKAHHAKHRNMNKQQKQIAQTTTDNNKHIQFYVLCFVMFVMSAINL